MVAPTNYKRPTALVTQGMIDKAVETIRGLDLEAALQRRHAVLADISINDVLWSGADAQSAMRDGLRDMLSSAVKPSKKVPQFADELTAEQFIRDVLPSATNVEIYFDNALQSNLMSLTAPVDPSAGQLFKWENNFAWSYVGDITDSIKEKVKAAGGNVNAKLRVSLAWSNKDDLDIHCRCPDGYVSYSDKRGILDVDMNSPYSVLSRTPVENLAWKTPRDGRYVVSVNQYSKREAIDVGFTLQVENNGSLTEYSYPNPVVGTIQCLDFDVRDGVIQALKVMDPKLTNQLLPRETWGISTVQFVKVLTVLNSPNHWDGHAIGNKHTFFILDGCKNPDPVRGIYNEFLALRPRTAPQGVRSARQQDQVPRCKRAALGPGLQQHQA
jgi:hypothetical protein